MIFLTVWSWNEIDLFTNSWFHFRSGKLAIPEVQIDTPDILNCDGFRTFWISWDNGRIALGTAAVVGFNELLSWQDSEPDGVAYLSISGWSNVAEWDIIQFSGKK